MPEQLTNPIPYFTIAELVPKRTLEQYKGRDHILWGLLDQEALQALVALREFFGPLEVNNYVWGGARQYSGWRPGNSKVGAVLSQHKFGRAFDCHFKNVTSDEVRAYVLAHQNSFPWIHSIEMEVSWFHFDTRYVANWQGVIQQFTPKK